MCVGCAGPLLRAQRRRRGCAAWPCYSIARNALDPARVALEPGCAPDIFIERDGELAMKQNAVVLTVSWFLSVTSPVAAQEALAFTLEEAEAAIVHDKVIKPENVDTKAVIAEALGDVHWGMSKADLHKLLKAQIRAEFDQRIKRERDVMRQDALYQEAQERYRRIVQDFVAFDGQKSGWDVSPVAAEFSHGNAEAMLVVVNKGSRDLYFFMQGKLWKWYRELAPEALDAADPEQAFEVLKERFGRGKPQTERVSEAKAPYVGMTWSDGATRVTALRRGGETCLVLEDTQTVAQLAALRRHAQSVGDKARAAQAIDSVLLTGAELEARSR